MKKILMVAALAAMGAGAAPVVEITSVQQQYPWTNTVDITYTSTGIESNNTYFVVFKAQDAAGNEIGILTNDLKVSQGSTWVAQWEPPFNVRYENCTMTPYVYKGGQDDYMVVDLETWAITYEGMSTQEASNEKYNTDEYKTRKMAFRKSPAGDYWIGAPSGVSTGDAPNSWHKVTVKKAYYFAIFPTTVAQYNRILTGKEVAGMNAYVGASWNMIRGSAGSAARASGADSVVAQLNAKTGCNFTDPLAGFDLPTSSMWEIAARARKETLYICGDDATGWDEYGSRSSTETVGLRLPNDWGIYSLFGPVLQRVRDTQDTTDLATIQPDPLVPISKGTSAANCEFRGNGGTFNLNGTLDRFAGRRLSPKNGSWSDNGFRFAYIPE